MSKSMDIQINIGYRSALVPEMKADKTITTFNAVQGEPLKGEDNEVLQYDYTGMIFQVSIFNKF